MAEAFNFVDIKPKISHGRSGTIVALIGMLLGRRVNHDQGVQLTLVVVVAQHRGRLLFPLGRLSQGLID